MQNWKLAIVIWLIASVTVAGAAVVVVLTVPQLYEQSAKLIPIVSILGFIVAYFISIAIAKQIQATPSQR